MKNLAKAILAAMFAAMLVIGMAGCDDGGGTTVNVTDVELSQSSHTLPVGDTFTLTPTVLPTNATNKAVTWESSNTAVATVANGEVTAVAVGETTITVKTKDGNKTAACTVKVIAALPPDAIRVTSVSLNKAALSLTAGGTETLTATVLPANATDKTLNWVTSNAAVATVDGTGKVTAHATTGNATITANWVYDDTIKATCTVTATPVNEEKVFQLGGAKQSVFEALPPSPYHVEVWVDANGADSAKLTWYGAYVKGGAAFKAEWTNADDYLGRVGYYWNHGGAYTTQKNIYVDYAYTKGGNAGGFSFIGIYGWSRNTAAAPDDLIEYYIVDNCFNDTPPNPGGTEIGSFYVDGSTYLVYKTVRPDGSPSIDGNRSFTQIFSVRQNVRQNGTISVTEHYKKWAELGCALQDLYECKFLVEAGGGIGWLDLSYLEFKQEDTARAPEAGGFGAQPDGSYTLDPAGFAEWYGATGAGTDTIGFTTGGVRYTWPVDFDRTKYNSLEIKVKLTAYTEGTKGGLDVIVKTFDNTTWADESGGTNVKYSKLEGYDGDTPTVGTTYTLTINDEWNAGANDEGKGVSFADLWQANTATKGWGIAVNTDDTDRSFTLQFVSITFKK